MPGVLRVDDCQSRLARRGLLESEGQRVGGSVRVADANTDLPARGRWLFPDDDHRAVRVGSGVPADRSVHCRRERADAA